MKLMIIIFIPLLFIENITLINGFFFSKSKKSDHHLIAAKYDPEMPIKVRQILEQVGDNPIIKIQLGRTPVLAVLTLILNILSKGKFAKKQLELGYDEVYHNYLLLTIQNKKGPNVLQTFIANPENNISRTVYKLEKAQRVRLMKPVYPTEFVDIYDIPLPSDKTFTLNRLITTASNIDKHFYTYDAANNNMCQTFVENVIDINGLTPNIVDEKTIEALKPQDARTLIDTLGSRRDIVKFITDLGGTVDQLVTEGKIKWKRPLKKEFARLGDRHSKKGGTDTKNTDDNNNDNEEILQSSGDTSDTVVDNADDVYNAVVALEEDDNAKKQKHMIITIIGTLLGVILLIGVTIAIGYFIWRKRKEQPMKNDLIDNNDTNMRESSSNLDENGDNTDHE